MKKGFTITEILIAILIILILSSVSLYWLNGYIRRKKIESDVQRIYANLKQLQVEALFTHTPANATLNSSQLMYFKVDDRQWNIILTTPFNTTCTSNTMRFQSNGIISPPYCSFYSQYYKKADISCIKGYALSICEGKWNGTDCICKF